MRHEQVREQLSSYVEGTLDPAMTASMDRHFDECASCAGEMEGMRRVYALLDSPAMYVEPPDPFHDNVIRKVRLAERERRRSPRGFLERLGWGWATAGAVSVTAVILVIVLAVGPLHDGLSAGFGLWDRPAPATSVAPASPGRLTVMFPPGATEGGSQWDIVVRAFAPEAGEWRLLGRPSVGLSILSPFATGPDGSLEIWQGPLAEGGAVDATVRLFTTMPGTVTDLWLRLERADGAIAAEQTVFLPSIPGAAGEAVGSVWDQGSLGATLADFVHGSGRPVSAPTRTLNASVTGETYATPTTGTRTDEDIALIARTAGLRARASGGGFILSQ